MFLIIIGVICLILILISAIKKALFIKKHREMILNTISSYRDELSEMCTSFVCHKREIDFINKWKSTYNEFSNLAISKNNSLHSLVSDFIKDYKNIHDMISLRNDMFIANEKVRCNTLLSNIDGKSLDDQQRTVVVSDEDNSLVLAGAGSGKTLTIAGKVKYLYEEKNINPEDILLISFTNKATDELNERIATKLNVPIQATTFHKLGLDILKKQKFRFCEVYDSQKLNFFIRKYFQKEVANQPELARPLIEYIAYYFNIPNNMEKYKSLGELFEHEKGKDFETLQSKYEKVLYIKQIASEKKQNKETLQGEIVRSLEEVTIANFLFLHGVRYEYERPYPFESEDLSRKKYTPDFYLPDYDLYIEHFGINKFDRLPWLSQFEENKYIADMRWKRKFHKKNGTKLLETYSYYAHEGRLLKELNRILKNNGVEYHEVDFCDIFKKIYTEKQIDKYFAEFIRLCATFITLFKSNGYIPADLKSRKYKNNKATNDFLVKRAELFKEIISPMLEAYEKHLIENECIDFSDMINKAAKSIEKGLKIHPYKYIIIDEFQDISVARYNLIKAIQSQTGAKTICVGDDWQSIFRFAGSDISLFTNFEKYFGYTRVMRLENTYRNAQELIDEASKFITKNPMQLQKNLHSAKKLAHPVEFWFFDDNQFSTIEKIIDKIIAEFGSDKSILFLGRTKYDEQMLVESNLFYFSKEKMLYKKSPKTPVTFLSVHKAKGLEADNVVLLNFKNTMLGFPNKIEDDPLLELVLTSEDTYEYAEERRVLYVALTRTKNRSYILVDAQHPSEFLKEFTPSNSVYYTSEMLSDSFKEKVECPRCKTGFLKIRHNAQHNNYFIGCSNYPQCDYTNSYTSILKSNRRCPFCGGYLIKKEGPYGTFWGCSNYHKNSEISCNYIENINKKL
jgi:DNA helicase-4